jgi:hypothetical protein
MNRACLPRFINTPIVWGYMGKKVNIYLDDDTLAMWEKTPSGERSGIIRDAIREYAKQRSDEPHAEAIRHLRRRQKILDLELRQRETEFEMNATQLLRLTGQGEVQVNKDIFWDELMSKAKTYQEINAVYSSFTGKSRYRIESTDDNRIRILNMRTKRTTSNFSQKTVDKALDRLIAAGGSLPIGQFIPVKMHEYAVVALHPRVYTTCGIIHWRYEEMTNVTENMIPEQSDMTGGPPPGDWVSNESWLAVTVDGRRGHVCINVRSYASTKIVYQLIDDDHPDFSEIDFWQTKRYIFTKPGLMIWGGGGPVEVLTPVVND